MVARVASTKALCRSGLSTFTSVSLFHSGGVLSTGGSTTTNRILARSKVTQAGVAKAFRSGG